MPPCPSLDLRSAREHPSDLYIAEENAYIPVSTRENIAQKHQCRISNSKLEQFQDAMAVYQGTHNFHNYTIQRSASDPSANRYIMQVEASDLDSFCHVKGVLYMMFRLDNQKSLMEWSGSMLSFGDSHSCYTRFER